MRLAADDQQVLPQAVVETSCNAIPLVFLALQDGTGKGKPPALLTSKATIHEMNARQRASQGRDEDANKNKGRTPGPPGRPLDQNDIRRQTQKEPGKRDRSFLGADLALSQRLKQSNTS